MGYRILPIVVLLGSFLLGAVACGGSPSTQSSSNDNAPNGKSENATIIPATPQPMGGGSPSGGSSGLPAWWDPALAMPKGSTLENTFLGGAMWSSGEADVDTVKGFMTKEATGAGYAVYLPDSPSPAGKELYFIKGPTAYHLLITNASGTTSLMGNRAGIMHIKTSGAVALVIDLPLAEGSGGHKDGGAFDLSARVTNPKCDSCEYDFMLSMGLANITYKGPGTYVGVTGMANPGVNLQGHFYNALAPTNACTVSVHDETSGTFDCKAMKGDFFDLGGTQNVQVSVDPNKTLDMSGSWQLPK